MEEIDKYYTPHIEEFHVGFEYQFGYKMFLADHSESIIWNPVIYNWRDEITITDNYRVKYLDKADIESLRWIYKYKADLDNYETEKHSCNQFEYIILNKDNNLSSRSSDFKLNFINHEEVLKIEFYERNHFEWYPCYEGMIKNKSELKLLMKQLGI